MAGSSEVLREYLLKLGFRVDAKSQRDTDNAVGKTEKRIFKLAGAITAVTGATAAMVTQYARDLDKMYYVSKKTDTPVAQLRALQFGFKQIGLSGEQAIATVEGISRSLRSNPGLTALLNDLGVPVKGRTKDQVLMDLVGALRNMPPHIANQYAALFGIDPDQLQLLEQGMETLQEASELRAKLAKEAGVSTEEATEAAHEYAKALNEIQERAVILKDTLMVALLPTFKKTSDAIKETLSNAAGWVSYARNSTPGQFFSEFKKRFIEGWNEKFGGGSSGTAPAVAPATAPTAPAAPLTGNLPLGLRNNNPGNLRAGLGQTGTNKGFATFNTQEDGLTAMARQLMLYQSRDKLKTISDIIKKYAPSSENNTQAYIDAVSKSMGIGANEYIDLKATGNMSSLMSAMVQHENGRNPFSTAQYDAAARSGTAATFNQQTNITVNGAADPGGTARAVGQEQRAVNSDLTRQMGTRKVE